MASKLSALKMLNQLICLSLKTKNILLKTKDGILKTEDILLKTKDGCTFFLWES